MASAQIVETVDVLKERAEAQLDWRLDHGAEVEEHQLPRQTRELLLDYVKTMGLRFGAIDLRLKPNGEYVFFEINPAGQFLFCEIEAGQPISRAFADALAGT